MKRTNLILYVAASLTIFLLFSCDKNENPEPPGLTGPLIHKWNIVMHKDTTVFLMAGIYYLDYTGNGSDYLDFNKNGKLYIYENGVRDTASFTVKNGNGSIDIDRTNDLPKQFTFNVRFLSDDSLHISAYQNHFAGSHDYRLVHYYLNRK
jgi:hypothetical protein